MSKVKLSFRHTLQIKKIIKKKLNEEKKLIVNCEYVKSNKEL